MKLSKIYAINVYRKFLEENTTDFDHANLWGESQGPGEGGLTFSVLFHFILPCACSIIYIFKSNEIIYTNCETTAILSLLVTIHSCCFHQDRKLF